MNNKLKIDVENGTKDAELVKIIYSDDVSQRYAVYTFNPQAEIVDLYAAEINEKDGKISFDPIKTKEEWEFIQRKIGNDTKGL